jgi:hypothetical protein
MEGDATVGKKKPAAETTQPTPDPRSALESLCQLDAQLTSLQAPVTEHLQAILDGLQGQSFGSLEANEAVTDALLRLLHRLDLRVECPRCHEPALPHCRAVRNAKDGSFQFSHTRGHRTNHGGSTTLPAFRLVAAPPDARRKRNSRK